MNRIFNLYKSAYSGLSPASWWLSLVMLINRSGTMVSPFITLYLTETMHFTIAKAGLVMSVYGLGAICGGVLGGRLTDKFGFYNIQISSLICGGVMFIVLGQMRGLPMICLCTFFLAVLNDAFRPANATAIAQYSKEDNRIRSYSLNRLAINLGWAIGGAIGGFIASHNYQLLFWIDGLTNIGAAILLRMVLSPSKNKQTPTHNTNAGKTNANEAIKDKIYLVFIFLTIIFGICFFQIFSTLPLFYHQELKLTPFFIGVVMSVNGLLIALFEMALVFTLEPKNKNILFISIGILFCGLSFVVFNLLPGRELLTIGAILLLTLGEMLSMPFMNSFWVSRTTAHNRGQYAGLFTAAWSIAQVTGPYAGSQVAQHLGFRTLWWIVGGISILAAVGFRWLGTVKK